MLRQKFKDESYFVFFFIETIERLKTGEEKLIKGKVASDMVKWFIKDQFNLHLRRTIASYTSGENLESVKEKLITTIYYMDKGWMPEVVLLNNRGKVYNQYAETYDEMLWILSLGYLLDIENDTFQKLVDFIDRDKVKDFLYEFIIQAKIKDRRIITEESWRKYFGIPWTFEKLRQVIKETEKESAEYLVKEFVSKEWYRRHKQYSWHDDHKYEICIYSGYWSFETAAVVKIMGLDDSSFIDCKYYPKDLVHQERSL
ncbi:DUF1911 domain-containing protein [Emticicia sp. CRIBPO]|uniref:PoNe immunity protein domain-containing protein n=1 Tax=Emticicia sp. CRIBPO TaxID=2683258 RepID=UPI00141222A7|nr:PoNe immunity protein domain-containing protein [Emticicia sp. CRIBPO]NBA87890.1 DUF1911 domain-containing protein [Emticicia sp. CRIBPO]